MPFVEEQIKHTRENDDRIFCRALENLCVGVTGDDSFKTINNIEATNDAIEKIVTYCGGKPAPPSFDEEHIEKILDFRLDTTGIKYRMVNLTNTFYKETIGCYMGITKDGAPVAILPGKNFSYEYNDPKTGKKCKVTKHTVGKVLTNQAYFFYRPLPAKKLELADITKFMFSILETRDYISLILAALSVTLVGMLIPPLNQFIFGPVINSGAVSLVIPVGIMLLSAALAQIFLSTIQTAVVSRLDAKLSINIESAFMMRILSLPASFFKKFSAGDLMTRFKSARHILTQLNNAIFSASIISLFSLVYILQLLTFSPKMAVPAFIAIVISLLANLIIAQFAIIRIRKVLKTQNKLNDLEISMLSAIQKIKLSGSEKRVFAKWADLFSKFSLISYGKPGIAVLAEPITLIVNALGLALIYFVAINGGISTAAEYMAFSSVYGMVTAAFSLLNSSLVGLLSIKPHLEQIEPILSTVPENTDSKRYVSRLGRTLSLQNITFKYKNSTKPIFDGFNLDIKPGEHIAIVGKTGCGKSTLIRIMLGFEKPDIGAVRYGGNDLAQLNTDSLRRNIGVVLQNSMLVSGTIFSNISLSNPKMTMADAWKVAEKVGLAEDIREMPMKMMTLVSEDGVGISGGQRQRILIARAIASNPKFLMLDEATSALDNITQQVVIDCLNSLDCTRIVVAHRLSTVRQCDRIIVLDQGKIIEEGSYNELINAKGFFADLVKRQRI